ncbi:MAG: hypothetical protein HRT45_17270, partial [Bdellovibrionales bacterium]|nr:hypothetical protein [Bdellovibrionales bacterium]
MEKTILPLMIVAFVFELFLFAADLGLISTPWSDRPQATKQSVIGKVSWKRQSVQTKSRDSILWQSSDKGEPLYSFDSVLTLKNSSAKLQLEGNIQIDLQENTLVVLEPQEKSDAQTFRIQFYKGDLRSKTGARRLAMQSGSWTVEAKPNTDLALKTLNSGRLSLEVRSGGASVQKGTGENSTQISSGTRLELSESRIEEQQSLTKNLQWSLKSLMINHYAFEFPVDFNLVWQGPAESLIAHNTRGDEIRYPVSSTDSNKLLSLDPGTWNFRLVNQQGTSQTLSVNLYPARKTKHIYPLPRSRADLKQELNFSWAPHPDAVAYMISL